MMDQMTPPPPMGKSKRRMPGQLAPPQTPKMPPPPMKPFQPLPQPSGGVYAQFNPTEQEVQRRMLPKPPVPNPDLYTSQQLDMQGQRDAALGAGIPEAMMGQPGIMEMIMKILGGAGQAIGPMGGQAAGPMGKVGDIQSAIKRLRGGQ